MYRAREEVQERDGGCRRRGKREREVDDDNAEVKDTLSVSIYREK